MKIAIFILIVLCSFNLEGQVVKDGVADLRNHNFDSIPQTNLNGEWRFYLHQLLTDSASNDSTEFTMLQVPVRWENQGIDVFNYGTYQVTILLDTETPLMLKVPDQFSAYEIYINGKLMGKAGIPAASPGDYKPDRRFLYLPFGRVQRDTITINIPIANYTHSKGGIGLEITLGTQSSIYHDKFIDDTYDLFMAGCLVMGAFFFLGLYMHGREERTPLYFALFSLAYAYRIVGWGNYVLHDLVDMPYRLGITVEYATFYLSGFFFSRYLEYLFPKETPRWLSRGFGYLSLLWAASTLLPVYIFTQLNIYYLYILLLGVIFIVFVFVRATLLKRPGAVYSLYSMVGVMIIFSMKSLDYLGVVQEIKLLSAIGELMFFLFQSLILSKHFTTSWRQAKLQAEKSAKAKSDFLSVMSHEIRTPLNAVIGITYHLIEQGPREDQTKDLTNLKSSSENLLLLINNILDYNKIDSGKIELEKIPVNLKNYCEQQISMFTAVAESRNLQLTLEYDQDLPKVVLIDKTRLSQILTNLIGNAVKFTNEGSVWLKVSQEPSVDDEHVIKFVVQDTGIGIDQQAQERVFQTFEQANSSVARQFGGTGLGLAISEKLLNIMDSKISLKSEENVGSEFSFVLKVRAVNTSAEEVHTAVSDLKGYSVLLVEDNNMNVIVGQRLLKRWQMEVDVAENGELAVAKALDQNYDIILMDLQMPGMDGFEATSIMRSKGIKIPIIALTAGGIDNRSSFLNQFEFDDVLIKPYEPGQLNKVIKEHLSARQLLK